MACLNPLIGGADRATTLQTGSRNSLSLSRLNPLIGGADRATYLSSSPGKAGAHASQSPHRRGGSRDSQKWRARTGDIRYVSIPS